MPNSSSSAAPAVAVAETTAPSAPRGNPLVSVVIPSYNYGHFVAQAVESALAQTYPNLEIIVVDDGSKDDTRQRLEPYLDRIRYIYQENRGLSAARNTGIRAARGEWVGLLDADDLWHPQKIEVQLAAVPDLDSVGLIGSGPAEDQLPASLAPNPKTERVGVREFLLSRRTGPSGALLRRTCVEQVGWFDEGLTSIEDRDMWLRVAARFGAVIVLSPCFYYRLHQGQMSRVAWRMYENYRKVLDNFFVRHPAYRRLRGLGMGYMYLDTALCFHTFGQPLLAFRFLLQSMLRWPWPLRDNRRSQAFRLKLLVRLCLGERLFRRFVGGRATAPEPRAASR
jgi:glycosyltransferase involved in cell wall biosynthesis